ncbi:ABC transporter permease [Fervidibacillus halotolerans]|uniref:ABC transporter permease n=1 Tax=Fervidibacillus halotolerans TaxID=2980027 RepID=A0A9E8LZE6_9BACI|nr:ABC transporter permease [Fervidibacillus halotolerans]WAA12522.1 ABC transporter permease [Fervidibacillus halotolerans]
MGFPFETYFTTWNLLLAGIDPEQEAKLVGLDQAMLSIGTSRYLTDDDISENILLNVEASETGEPEIYSSSIPVIVSSQTYTNYLANYKIEKLDLPFDDIETARETLAMVEEKGGEKYLNNVKGKIVQTFSYRDKEIYARLVNSLSGYDIETGEPYTENHLGYIDIPLLHKPSGLSYKAVTSPFPENWPYAYELEKVVYNQERNIEGFREQIDYDRQDDGQPIKIQPNWIGIYDPSKLNISKDPLSELPMETYRPATAELVIDENLKPINPPEVMNPEINPSSFLGNPPTMLTTLDAAALIAGEKPISAIRVKVAGVEELNEESQEKIEKVATEIEEKTGLETDITLGSSPHLTLVHVPSINNNNALGWIQQPWIKLGSSITIFKEAKVGYSILIFCVIAVAIVYVWAMSLVSLLTRRKAFAVLLAVGWRPRQLSKLMFVEAGILGSLATIISWMMLGFVYLTEEVSVSVTRFLLIGFLSLIIYLIGAIIPALLVRNISPMEAIRSGEIIVTSKKFLKTSGIFSMAMNHFFGKWKRNVLSIVAIAMPASLLALFLYITISLRGTMYTTLLGQYVAMEVGPVHYTAVTVSLLIAILTTIEIMWQNISERTEEIALLKAIGWKNRSIRMLIWTEGILIGFGASLLAIVGTISILMRQYSQLETEILVSILFTGLIPITVALIASVIPAEKAASISPIEGLRGQYTNQKITENRIKRFIMLSFFLMIGIVIFLLFLLFIK